MTKNKVPRDPNAPKRNLSAYLLYQNFMRDTFRAQNPQMGFGDLSKYTSQMYALLTPDEKQGWQTRAETDKARYLNALALYHPPPGYDSNGNFILRPNIPGGGKKNKERDPQAPKRNLSAYLLYQNAMREQFKRDNPGMTFGQLSKYTSHMYKSLTAEEKSAWEYRAQQDKTRFDEQMRSYVPPPGYDANGSLLVEYKIQRKNSKKTPKDPNAPKRARGSFVLFTFDYRPKVLAEYPGIKFTELGTVLGEKWRNLSPEERKKYDELAQDDKMRFAAEMDVYKSQKGLLEVENNNAYVSSSSGLQTMQSMQVMHPYATMALDHQNTTSASHAIDPNNVAHMHPHHTSVSHLDHASHLHQSLSMEPNMVGSHMGLPPVVSHHDGSDVQHHHNEETVLHHVDSHSHHHEDTSQQHHHDQIQLDGNDAHSTHHEEINTV